MNQANQLAYVFRLFTNASSNLPLSVNANNEKSQVIDTTWLLSVLDFIHLNLGIIDNDDERDYDGKQR
ncbi:MAG TPA: hypothetical protein VH796_10545 [Nitrososphaeraceae archaeon]|jgi:hypothetical protein